jgi:hypothetical protein
MSAAVTNITVRGHSTYARRAPPRVQLLALMTDLVAAALFTELIYAFFGFSPVPNLRALILLVAIAVVMFLLSRLRILISSAEVISISIGEWIWGIHRVGEARSPQISNESQSGIFLTVLMFAVGYGVFEWKIARTPQWVTSYELPIEAVVPPSNWRVLAFHYSLAAWPEPVAYFMPYEFGPPKRFVGRVEAILQQSNLGDGKGREGSVENNNDEKIVFEGPKTPMDFASGSVTRTELRNCVLGSPSFHCALIRDLALSRPLDEMKKVGFSKFELRWFSAKNPMIPEEERAQGIYLHGSGGTEDSPRYQDRYILVSPKGMQQSIIFSYLKAASGQDSLTAASAMSTDGAASVSAADKMKIALGTLRFSDDLNPGRAWVDRELEATRLGELPSPSSDEYIPRLIQAEGLLISKISVEPGPIESYFHLAGIQALLLQYGIAHHRPDLVDNAKQTLDQVYRFSKDIAAQSSPESTTGHLAHDIEKLWHESQKL